MHGTAFKHKICQMVVIHGFNSSHLRGNVIVLIPWEIKTVNQATIGIKFPVYGAHATETVYDKSGTSITNPRIVVTNLNNLHIRHVHFKQVEILGFINTNYDWLILSNSLNHFFESGLSVFGIKTPVIFPFRPE